MIFLKFCLLILVCSVVFCQDFLFPDEIEERSRFNFQSRGSVLRSNPRRISQLKCEEYKELTEETNIFGSFSLDNDKHAETSSTCSATAGLVVGGVDANPNEFPHMVALGYRENNENFSFNCGGSLISANFVLTAAHCSSPSSEPVVVRLGNHNLKHKDHVDIEVLKFIRNPLYNNVTRENDIALIELKRNARFSNAIRPACIHQTTAIGSEKVVATGWGFTSYKGLTSDTLQKVGLDILDNNECQKGSNTVFNSQICAGVKNKTNDEEKDTCNGDSGGPLQTTIGNACVFDVVGIVSYGSTSCGSAPGIYSRVSSYIDWIEGTVWPNGV